MTREHPSPEAEAVMSETSVRDMCAREASGNKERCTLSRACHEWPSYSQAMRERHVLFPNSCSSGLTHGGRACSSITAVARSVKGSTNRCSGRPLIADHKSPRTTHGRRAEEEWVRAEGADVRDDVKDCVTSQPWRLAASRAKLRSMWGMYGM